MMGLFVFFGGNSYFHNCITIINNRQKIMSTSGIPNVSSIFRDLSHLSTAINHKSPTNHYSLESEPYSYNKSSTEEMYSYKQKRHNELMNKLQKSYEENRNLLRVGGEDMHNKMMETHFHSKMAQGVNAKDWGEAPYQYDSRRNTGGFVMPKIKYRHIEDQKKNSRNVTDDDNKKSPEQQKLQKQFYQDSPSAFINSKNNMQAYKTEGFTQTKKNNNIHQFQDDAQSEISHPSTMNRNGDYEDKLESYYNLCRKNLVRKDPMMNKTDTKREDKFLRAGGTKTKALRLDEAVKILSMD